ncbi:MBOAT family protein [Nannocystis pusilla]|uniref:MBOAT family protein n=1 Tax=Nannocystis pusilla TaxID=889268 RepID=UPI003B78569E
MLALLVLAALVTAGSPLRRALGLLVALPAFLAPFGADSPFLRALLAAAAFWGFARLIDLAREPREFGPLRRVVHVLAIVDSRRCEWVPPRFDVAVWSQTAVAAAFMYMSLWTGVVLAPHHGGLPLRWLAGCAFIYAFAETAAGLLEGIGRLLGARVPPVQRHPILARSLRDFWGERWNLVVNRWLRQHCFVPLARRGHAGAGLALAFAVSVALHTWIVAASLDLDMVLRTAAFFSLQGVLLAVEGPLRVRRWPLPLARAWALGGTILPSPLFTEPMLRMFAELVT